MTRIRKATTLDTDSIRRIHLSAFPAGEGEIISRFAENLLNENTNPPTINLVSETKDGPVGHVAFSPVSVRQAENWQGYILAPLGVRPGAQKKGVGSELVENGIRMLKTLGANILFVYGDPEYYSRFGFNAAVAENYQPPYPLQYPFGWQAMVLNNGENIPLSAKLECVDSLRDPKLW